MKKVIKLIFVTVFRINMRPIEKSKEDIQETIQSLKQKLFEKKPINDEPTTNITPIENSQEICQELMETLQNNVFLNLTEESHQNSQNYLYSTKCKISNPDLKPLNFLQEKSENPGNSQLFFPETSPNDNLLYGTKNFYIFMRFFYSFYEQILMGYQLSQKFDNDSILTEEVIFFFF